MSDLNELFRSEGQQYLQMLNDNLLELEKADSEQASRECLDEMFRAAHSLKGMAGTMGYRHLADLTHRMEDLFDQLREGQLELTPSTADLLFEALDVLEFLIAHPEEELDNADMIQRFEAAMREGSPLPASSPAAAPRTQAEDEVAASAVSEAGIASGTVDAAAHSLGGDPLGSEYRVLVRIAREAPMKSVRAHVVLRALEERSVLLGWRPDPENDPDEAFDDGLEVFCRTDLSPAEIAQHLDNIPDVIGVECEEAPADVLARLTSGADGSGGAAASAQSTGAVGSGTPTPAGRGPDSSLPPSEAQTGSAAGASLTAKTPAGSASPGASRTAGQAARSTGSGSPAASKSGPARRAAKGNGNASGSGGARGPSGPTLTPDRIVRVDTEQLDALLNLVGELVIHRIRLREVSSEERERNAALAETMEQIDRITDSLQDSVMALRMVPVGQVFARFPRVVRDISRKFNKRIDFITEGEETELDRSIVHRLGDPLVHLIRNAADHGIEGPEERERLGKPPAGQLRLSARHEGNHVIIEVHDDGRGIDPDRITQIALERGVITLEEAESLSESERLELIFRPGFSTSTEVTDVSGRGVGMDAVKTAIESFNGQVEIASRAGEGTRITLRLPLTLAIIPALLVRCQVEIYALPLGYVVQNLRLRPQEIRSIQGFPHVVWQEDILPVRDLAQLMELPPAPAAEQSEGEGHRGADDGMTAVVIDTGGRRSALHVDEILGQQEIVITNIGSIVGDVQGIAGATILGSGRVALIVDLPSLV